VGLRTSLIVSSTCQATADRKSQCRFPALTRSALTIVKGDTSRSLAVTSLIVCLNRVWPFVVCCSFSTALRRSKEHAGHGNR